MISNFNIFINKIIKLSHLNIVLLINIISSRSHPTHVRSKVVNSPTIYQTRIKLQALG